MEDWNIPLSTEDLFTNEEVSYWIKSSKYSGDNVYAMRLFLESVGVPDKFIEEDNGTQVILYNGQKRLVIDSGGLGDFCSHGYDVSVVEETEEERVLKKDW